MKWRQHAKRYNRRAYLDNAEIPPKRRVEKWREVHAVTHIGRCTILQQHLYCFDATREHRQVQQRVPVILMTNNREAAVLGPCSTH